MYYKSSLTIPANTPKSAKVYADIQCGYGKIIKIDVGFPPGCCNLAHVALEYEGAILWPSSPDEYLAWDNYIFSWNEDFPMFVEPYILRIVGYNEDSLYEHTISVLINMLSGVNTIEDYLKRLFFMNQFVLVIFKLNIVHF